MSFGCRLASTTTNTLIAVVLSAALPAFAPAQSSSSAFSAAQAHVPQKTRNEKSILDAGSVNAGVYRNTPFGFSCIVPAGWVLRTDEMNARADGSNTGKAGNSTDKASRVLLAAFSRPPEARAEDVNASILIAAESVASYPGLSEAAQYFGPVTEIAKARGFATAEEPYEFAVGTKMLVRGDFQKDVGTRRMLQSTLVMLSRGYAISFTFIGGTEDEVDELIAGLSFGGGTKPHSH